MSTIESSRSPCSYCGTEILRSMVNYATEFIDQSKRYPENCGRVSSHVSCGHLYEEVKMMTPDRSQECEIPKIRENMCQQINDHPLY